MEVLLPSVCGATTPITNTNAVCCSYSYCNNLHQSNYRQTVCLISAVFFYVEGFLSTKCAIEASDR